MENEEANGFSLRRSGDLLGKAQVGDLASGHFQCPALIILTAMRISLSFFVLLINFQWLSAQNHDHVWLFGYDSNPTYLEWGGTVMDFNNSPPNLSYLYNEMNFVEVNASICNQGGDLQFYTNGLYVANKNHQPMLNGIGLNPGPFANDMGDIGYILDQGAFIIPHPDGTNRYLIHADRVNSTVELKAHSSKLYYTLIDMNQANGLGKVIQKNQVILSDTIGLGKLTSVRHANGRDWWLLATEYLKNSYYRILITPEGVQNLGTSSTGNPLPKEGIGQAVFTPDGSKYIRNSLVGMFQDTDYLDIYDFDRCTGLLSNQIRIPYVHGALAGGVAVSPNSRFIYMPHESVVYQFDLWADNIAASKKVVATYDGFTENGIPTPFYLAQLAPDGKIYINVSNGVHYLHVIHQPNLPFPDCNVEQHGIHLPTYNSASLPNFPNYRLGPLDGSPCDTLGLDNHPIAKFRYDQDTSDYLSINFTDLSYYEPTTYGWQFGDGSSSNEINPVHTYASDGTYEVCLTVANGYGLNTYCRTLQIGTTATGEATPEVNLTVFPNPAMEATNIILSDYLPRHATLTLYTATGQSVLRHCISAGWNTVPLEGIAPGLYFYEVKDEERVLKSGKLVKQ
ncbi:MAG: PKD domain-containing protein [Bacteroidetes bacterium]|nr:PKD domain-containing protein [Bacteroidota bacterium]